MFSKVCKGKLILYIGGLVHHCDNSIEVTRVIYKAIDMSHMHI